MYLKKPTGQYNQNHSQSMNDKIWLRFKQKHNAVPGISETFYPAQQQFPKHNIIYLKLCKSFNAVIAASLPL